MENSSKIIFVEGCRWKLEREQYLHVLTFFSQKNFAKIIFINYVSNVKYLLTDFVIILLQLQKMLFKLCHLRVTSQAKILFA